MRITNYKLRILKISFLVLTLLSFSPVFAQFTIPEKPSFQTSVYDYAKVLDNTEKQQLEEKLIRYSDSTTTQIVVITIESLKGEDIGILTPKWGQTWGIGGTAKNDNGVIILLAKEERKIWISAGYGLEDRLTAGVGGEITRNIIIPEFKAGSYYNGLDKGTDAIFEVFNGKYKGTREQDGEFPISALLFIIIFIIIIIIVSKNNKGNNGGRGGGMDLSDIIILSSLGRNSGGFGGSSGGGFSGGFGGGFGGGGFSGGGSGGSW